MSDRQAAMLNLHWLGVPAIEYEGQPVHLEMRKTLAILAYLSVEAHSATRESLAAMFWPEYDQQHALASLRRNLSSLNSSLPLQIIEADREKIGLRHGDQLWVDVEAFRGCLDSVRQHGHATGLICADCLASLEKAAALYKGDFLEGFTLRDCPAFDEWQLYQREGLQSDYDEVLARLVAYFQDQGEWEQAIAYARHRVAGDPLNEEAQRELISLYQSSGQRSMALRQYESLTRVLESELGQAPEAESQSLYQKLRLQTGAYSDQQGQILPQISARDSEPLIKTKLYIPPRRVDQVVRPRLLELLDAGIRRSLTLLSAPAGFGKTALLISWATHSQLPIAWYSIDEGDNDPSRFMAYLMAAVESILPQGIGERLRAYPQALQSSIQPMLIQVINALASVQEPVVLILDDYQNIHSMEIHKALSLLMDRIPQCLHLVIATRTDPPLSLARLRAQDQLAELRMNELRFSQEETSSFFSQSMNLDISSEDISALEARTEGWIAGLQMAALAIRSLDNGERGRGESDKQGKIISKFVQSFSASNRYIMDYLSEEVLGRCPDQDCSFLLQTSILEQFSGPLCDAVMASEGSQAILEKLERENAFLVSLDSERNWYRYHPIFAELLRIKLAEIHSGSKEPRRNEIPSQSELHSRAARWMEDNKHPGEAIEHYIAAKDYQRAAELMESHAHRMFFILGQAYSVLQWCTKLPEEVVQHRPKLNIAKAWALIAQSRFSEAGGALEMAQQAVIAHPDAQEDSISGEIALIKGVLAELSERDTDVMRAEGQYAWKRLPQEESMLRGLAAWLLGAAYFYDGETNNAETYLVQAIQLCRQSGNIFFTLISIVELSNVFREQGKYGEAYQLLLQTQREMSAGEYPTHPGLEYIYNGLSQILFARNDVAEAEQMLQRSIDLSGQGVPGEIPIFGLSTMVYVKMAQGKTGEARQLAEECLQRAEAYPLPYVPATVKAGLIRLWIMVAVPERIDAWLASCQLKPDDSIRYAHEAEYTALAKALLWQGKTQEALKVLNQLADLAIRQGRNGKLIYLLALKALALNQAGDIEQALATLETSLGMAQREGIIRPYVDEGEPMEVLLRSGSERGIWKEEALEKFVIRVLEAY